LKQFPLKNRATTRGSFVFKKIVGVNYRVFPNDIERYFVYGMGRFEKYCINTVSIERSLSMPRYLVERTFPDGLAVPINNEGAQAMLDVVANNALDGVTWVRSFVTSDKKKTFCIYDGPSPEAIRNAADRNNLPVDSIIQISVLDPYFYL
jgi:hypothetical protein